MEIARLKARISGLEWRVNPAIKKALRRGAGRDRAWLSKVRPWYGHDYHFHDPLLLPGRGDEVIRRSNRNWLAAVP